MRRVRIDVQNIVANIIVDERNDTNVMTIKNISAKKKTKRVKTNIDIGDNSWKIVITRRISCKHNPIRMMTSSHEGIAIAI